MLANAVQDAKSFRMHVKMAAELPLFTHILETTLYTNDFDKARHFYGEILKLKPNESMDSPRGIGFELGNCNLLIFALGKTTEDIVLDPSEPAYRIPRHGPSEHFLDTLLDESKKPDGASSNSLRQHYCLAVETLDEVKRWHTHLVKNNVPILGLMDWSQGGHSVYFADYDNHVGEIACRGIWPNWR